MPSFIDDRDLDREARLALLERTFDLKHGKLEAGRPLEGKQLALIMTKPSLRTRTSFTVAVRRLGGDIIEVSGSNTKLGKGEDLQEWAAVLGRMVDGMIARVHGHQDLIDLDRFGGVPVINALSDLLHPCQGLADAFTVYERARLAGDTDSAAAFFQGERRWVYLGDGNNVAHSLMLTAASLGVTLVLGCPEQHQPDPAILEASRALHGRGGEGIVVEPDPRAAVENAQMIYTDTWVSMGQEGALPRDEVIARFEPYRVDDALMDAAAPGAFFMHCLPAVPGEEVTAEVLRGPRSAVLDQAEHRLWTSLALLGGYVFA